MNLQVLYSPLTEGDNQPGYAPPSRHVSQRDIQFRSCLKRFQLCPTTSHKHPHVHTSVCCRSDHTAAPSEDSVTQRSALLPSRYYLAYITTNNLAGESRGMTSCPLSPAPSVSVLMAASQIAAVPGTAALGYQPFCNIISHVVTPFNGLRALPALLSGTVGHAHLQIMSMVGHPQGHPATLPFTPRPLPP
jgi:hypothetical protein